MRAFLVLGTLLAVAAASPAPDVTITSTQKPFGVCWETGTHTSTVTIPGTTATIHDPHTLTTTITEYTYPTQRVEPRAPEKTTIVVVAPCSETSTVDPRVTSADPRVTTTTTAYADTVTSTFTYTLCIPGNMCG
ncbi:hypothetical protein AURDEDRAFT_121600 [Auricularia subglabra TFB-10046 SS5]|nr:hypothetical protein AURDEDRAFT_121600 [Auricularia subglabra TFB-10046 SS5]